jgi:hypothetical protein
MPDILTHAEYSDMHFIGCFCSASTRAAVVDYQLQYPLGELKISKHLRTYRELWERLVHSPA